jgi:deazaflavin-dependent oxidoreductase (nitroreductase family)
MAPAADIKARRPAAVRFFDPIAKRLLGAGVPIGPNALITTRGRKSGLPRTTPVALVELDGQRWVQSPFGEVNWVRNLRESGEATLAIGKRHESVSATELGTDDAATFYAERLAPYFRRIPAPVRWAMGSMIGMQTILEDPAKAALEHPVFELVGVSPPLGGGVRPQAGRG